MRCHIRANRLGMLGLGLESRWVWSTWRSGASGLGSKPCEQQGSMRCTRLEFGDGCRAMSGGLGGGGWMWVGSERRGAAVHRGNLAPWTAAFVPPQPLYNLTLGCKYHISCLLSERHR